MFAEIPHIPSLADWWTSAMGSFPEWRLSRGKLHKRTFRRAMTAAPAHPAVTSSSAVSMIG
jgi:hypothetical protein